MRLFSSKTNFRVTVTSLIHPLWKRTSKQKWTTLLPTFCFWINSRSPFVQYCREVRKDLMSDWLTMGYDDGLDCAAQGNSGQINYFWFQTFLSLVGIAWYYHKHQTHMSAMPSWKYGISFKLLLSFTHYTCNSMSYSHTNCKITDTFCNDMTNSDS